MKILIRRKLQEILWFLHWNEFLCTLPEELWKLLCTWQDEYSPIYKLWISFIPFIFIQNPDDMQTMLSNTKNIEKGYIHTLFHPWLGSGLLTSKGAKWHKRRKMLTDAFYSKYILNQFVKILIKEGNYMTKSLKDGRNIIIVKDLISFISEHTLNAICEIATGNSLKSQNLDFQQQYRNAVHDMTELIVYRLFRSWFFIDFLFSLSPQGRKQKKVLKILHGFTEKIIAERKLYHKRTNNQVLNNLENGENVDIETKKEKKLILLDLLIAETQKGLLTDMDIKEEVNTFMFGGHDTTAIALTFALLLLAEHKDVQERVRHEVNTVLQECAGKLTRESLGKLLLLERCIKETLRMYPPVFLIFRKTMKDVKLQSYVIPAGTNIGLNIYGLHRNFWPNPDIFEPDRFLPGKKNRHYYCYLSFSAGRRNCISQQFAIIKLKVFIAVLINQFYLEPVTNLQDIRIKADVLMRPSHAMSIKFIPIT